MMETSSGSEDFSDTIFWFLHENSNLSTSSSSEWAAADHYEDSSDDSAASVHDDKITFWHAQQQLLQAILCRTTPTESRVRQATEEALRESAPPCHCKIPAGATICRICLRTDISERLRRAGFECSIRTSKWNKTSKIPSGEHTYLEVAEEKKKGRIIVELHLRAEFEMAKAGAHYDRLVSILPEVYVGKPERLRDVVTLLCGAAKRCIKENNMHMPPWRKLKYMQSKWFSASATCQIAGSVTASDDPPLEGVVAGLSGDRSTRRARASMLTFALLGNLPGSLSQPVAVV
ncbi:hypothetical protein V2J09_019201 [Rumex salicifolius]